jgi:hypothetical protein
MLDLGIRGSRLPHCHKEFSEDHATATQTYSGRRQASAAQDLDACLRRSTTARSLEIVRTDRQRLSPIECGACYLTGNSCKVPTIEVPSNRPPLLELNLNLTLTQRTRHLIHHFSS